MFHICAMGMEQLRCTGWPIAIYGVSAVIPQRSRVGRYCNVIRAKRSFDPQRGFPNGNWAMGIETTWGDQAWVVECTSPDAAPSLPPKQTSVSHIQRHLRNDRDISMTGRKFKVFFDWAIKSTVGMRVWMNAFAHTLSPGRVCEDDTSKSYRCYAPGSDAMPIRSSIITPMSCAYAKT